MLKINKDQHRSPIGGHQYPENGLLVRGDTFKEVVQKLTEYRLNNHIKVGNPEQDVLLHYAKQWPYMVKHDPDAAPKKENQTYEQYRKWVEATWVNPPVKTLSAKEASDRWAVCDTCPFNKAKDWRETKESAELARRTFLLRRGMDAPQGLGVCSLHFHADLSVLSFIEQPAHFVDITKDAAKPEKCWVK